MIVGHAHRRGLLAVIGVCMTAGIAATLLATSGAPAQSATGATLTAAKRKVVRHWVPASRSSWQWVLDHPLGFASASDMGTHGTLSTGARASSPQVYDIDGFDNSASTVNRLHALHKRAICYISVGTWENWRPDASRFPAALRGAADPGWTGEQWLNISPRGRYYRTLRSESSGTPRGQWDVRLALDGVFVGCAVS
jgi:hypothetical protein